MKKSRKVAIAEAEIVSELDIKSIFRRQQGKLNIRFPHDLFGKEYANWFHSMTSTQREEAVSKLNVLSAGNYSVMPRVCAGLETCPLSHVCPFKDNVPIDLQCPVEQRVVVDKMNSLMEELHTDGFKQTEFMLLNRLVELELVDFRLTSAMAGRRYQALMVPNITGSTNQGEMIVNDIVNPLFDLKEKISRERMKLLAVLVKTPQEVYKKKAALKEVTDDAYANKIANMNRKLMDLDRKMVKALEEKPVEEEFVEGAVVEESVEGAI